MRRALCAAAALAALGLPAAAFGHAGVVETQPGYRQRLQRSPAEVRIRFDQAVTALPNAVRVLDATGRVVSGRPGPAFRGKGVGVPVTRLPRGAYTVRWQALSGDGHVVSGVYTFGVGVAAPEPTAAVGASGPTRTEDVVRWLYFVGLALLVGGVAFRLVVAPRAVPAAYERRFWLLAGLGVGTVLEVGILAFLLRAEDALQLPFGRFVYGDLSPIAGGTRFGTAFIAMTLGFALVAALLFLGWLTGRRAFLWATLALALVFASGLSLSGHSAADAGSSAWSELADWVHLCAACLWAGGLVQLVAATGLRREAFPRFARLAPVLVGAVVAAGTYLAILRLPATSDLWREWYGRVLAVKLGLVCLALAWGGLHHLLVAPRLDRPGVLGRLTRSLAGESAVALAVLLVAAVLTDSRPPRGRPPVSADRPLVRAGP